MEKQGLGFGREIEMTIFYDGQDIGTRRVDFFVEEKIMVELKAVSILDDLHLAQAMNYLEAYDLPVGLLINFGSKSMEFKEYLIPNILITLIIKERLSELRFLRLKDDRI